MTSYQNPGSLDFRFMAAPQKLDTLNRVNPDLWTRQSLEFHSVDISIVRIPWYGHFNRWYRCYNNLCSMEGTMIRSSLLVYMGICRLPNWYNLILCCLHPRGWRFFVWGWLKSVEGWLKWGKDGNVKKLCKPYPEMKKSRSCKCTDNVHLQAGTFTVFNKLWDRLLLTDCFHQGFLNW